MELTFVAGTGRCGSTLLSRILARHPGVLSMSEFFGVLRLAGATGRSKIPAGDMTGADLWDLLSRPFPMLDAMVTAGLRTAEMTYPFGCGRFDPATGVPLISHFTLPMLTGEPDELFAALAAEVPRWPRRPAAAQYQALFAHLAGRMGRTHHGRTVVVERSAASLTLIGALHEQFPSARFVHLHRDGPDCSLSMSRNPMFRREVLGFRPPYDAAALMTHPIPVEVFGRRFWSPMICAGVTALRRLDPSTWTELRYEDLLRDPATALTRLAAFIGTTAPRNWLAEATAMIDPARAATAKAEAELDPAAFAALRHACEPGARALREETPP